MDLVFSHGVRLVDGPRKILNSWEFLDGIRTRGDLQGRPVYRQGKPVKLEQQIVLAGDWPRFDLVTFSSQVTFSTDNDYIATEGVNATRFWLLATAVAIYCTVHRCPLAAQEVFSDYTRATIDRRGVFNDRTRAHIDHTPVFSDRTGAHIDHTSVFSDRTGAHNDHTPVFSDHTRAHNDHTPVFNDHTRAHIDHRGVLNDHTRANIDHRPVFSMHSMVIDIHIDHSNSFSPNFNDHTPVFRMRSMVLFMHIDYNNSCTRVFRMCLMVIDIYID